MGQANYPAENQCRLCGIKNLNPLYKFPSCRLEHCKKCGFVQVDNQPQNSELHSLYSKEYFQRGKYVKDKATENSCLRRIKWLQNHGVNYQARVLEVGCSTGDFISFAKTHFNMWGVDISEYAVNLAKKKNPEISEQISCQMAENLHFQHESFDAIVLWDVVEHLWNPLEILTNLVRFLRYKGITAYSTPNIGSPIAKLMGKRWALMTVPEHLCFFDRKTSELLNNKAGLRTIGWMTRGTWSNLGFILYKAARIMPDIIPENLVNWAKRSFISKGIIYVPTRDIQFCAAQKITSL